MDAHVAVTPEVMAAGRVVEYEQGNDHTVQADYDGRSTSRRMLTRHVVTRLQAEELLHPIWTVDTATDLLERLMSATTTHALLRMRDWSVPALRERLLHTFRRSLFADHDTRASTSVDRHRTDKEQP